MDKKLLIIGEKYQVREAIEQMKLVQSAIENGTEGVQGFPVLVVRLILKYQYLFDFIKFHTYMAENEPEFMKSDSIKMGIAGMASMASSVVQSGGIVGPAGTSMVLKVAKGDLLYIPSYLNAD